MLVEGLLEHKISLRAFDTYIGLQGMEYVREHLHYLVPLLSRCGPSHVLVIVALNSVILFLNSINERASPSGYDCKH